MSEFYRERKILVTGGLGFLGSHVVRRLLESGANVRVATNRDKLPSNSPYEIIRADLTRPEDCRRAVSSMEFVFHLAAFGWGIGENVKLQSQLFTMNVLMNTSVLDAAARAGIERYLFTSSSAVYPGTVTILDDEQPWSGDPHGSEFAFGWAKRAGELQARIYDANSGMRIAIVRPANPYGPYDNFHPEKAHVIPSLIVKAFERRQPFMVWGSGTVERSFVHADDVARAMLLALEHYAVCDPVNIASPEVTRIADIARMVLEFSGCSGAELVFDATKPEGHPKKYPSTRKADEKLGFRATINLQKGLQDTIEWYRFTTAKQSS